MAPSSPLPASFHVTSKIDFSKPIDRALFKGRNVIVTGGASGIGLGVVTAFAEAGASVTILDLNVSVGTKAATELAAHGHKVHFHETDVTSWESQVSGFASAVAFGETGGLDIVVCSAGLPTTTMVPTWLAAQPSSRDVAPTPPPLAVLDVNLRGSLYTAHLALHHFKLSTAKPTSSSSNASSKQLIFIGSTASYTTTNEAADYAASKYGVRGLWKSLRYMPHILSPNPAAPDTNVPLFRTNLVAPTMINTPMTAQVVDMIKKVMPVGEIADVVEAVMRVAGDESVSGRAVCVPAGNQTAGDSNFDLEDDWETLEGGPFLDSVNGGALKGLEYFCRKI